ncbi:MAG: hypothetical protein KKH98_07330, partial [Spirochaetes bacterium]|nr:hypothetical protein [Spirochaetota bacterium]
DLSETLGNFFTKNETVLDFIKKLTEGIGKLDIVVRKLDGNQKYKVGGQTWGSQGVLPELPGLMNLSPEFLKYEKELGLGKGKLPKPKIEIPSLRGGLKGMQWSPEIKINKEQMQAEIMMLRDISELNRQRTEEFEERLKSVSTLQSDIAEEWKELEGRAEQLSWVFYNSFNDRITKLSDIFNNFFDMIRMQMMKSLSIQLEKNLNIVGGIQKMLNKVFPVTVNNINAVDSKSFATVVAENSNIITNVVAGAYKKNSALRMVEGQY